MQRTQFRERTDQEGLFIGMLYKNNGIHQPGIGMILQSKKVVFQRVENITK